MKLNFKYKRANNGVKLGYIVPKQEHYIFNDMSDTGEDKVKDRNKEDNYNYTLHYSKTSNYNNKN
jgi:hypothetical protein